MTLSHNISSVIIVQSMLIRAYSLTTDVDLLGSSLLADTHWINTLRAWHNGPRFADYVFKMTSKCIPRDPIVNVISTSG